MTMKTRILRECLPTEIPTACARLRTRRILPSGSRGVVDAGGVSEGWPDGFVLCDRPGVNRQSNRYDARRLAQDLLVGVVIVIIVAQTGGGNRGPVLPRVRGCLEGTVSS